MLVNLTPNVKEQQRRESVAKENGFEYLRQDHPSLIQDTGIYQCNFAFNFSENDFLEYDIDKKVFNIPFENAYEAFKPTYHKVQYGVADSIEQIKEYYKEEIEDTAVKYFIYVTPVYQERANRGKWVGWRWHKWGEYIGKLNPKCEYLDDEDFGDDFEYVICFHLVKI